MDGKGCLFGINQDNDGGLFSIGIASHILVECARTVHIHHI
jgi:hypothetical protein